MSLRDVIIRARTSAKLSQRELAKHLKVSGAAVAQWELGQTQPTIENRLDLAQLLGIRFTDLLPEVGDRVVTVSDPTIIRIVQILEQAPPSVTAGLCGALLELSGNHQGANPKKRATDQRSGKRAN